MRQLVAQIQRWPLRDTFRISRGSKTETRTVLVEITDGKFVGRGESVPYPRYDETPEKVLKEIERLRTLIEEGLNRHNLLVALHAGAARNAIDCALWDLEAKQANRRIWELIGVSEPAPVNSAMTLSLDTAENMGRAAANHARLPLLKLKVTGEGDLERIRAVHESAPNARLIIDANEAWTTSMLEQYLPVFAKYGVEMVEQPVAAANDGVLTKRKFDLPLCADESCHTRADLPQLVDKYQVVNVKLDKTGGLTEALAVIEEAKALGFRLMIGSMVGTSLAMAPAMMLTSDATWVDLDGPLLLSKDRDPGLDYRGTTLKAPVAELWG